MGLTVERFTEALGARKQRPASGEVTAGRPPEVPAVKRAHCTADTVVTTPQFQSTFVTLVMLRIRI